MLTIISDKGNANETIMRYGYTSIGMAKMKTKQGGDIKSWRGGRAASFTAGGKGKWNSDSGKQSVSSLYGYTQSGRTAQKSTPSYLPKRNSNVFVEKCQQQLHS